MTISVFSQMLSGVRGNDTDLCLYVIPVSTQLGLFFFKKTDTLYISILPLGSLISQMSSAMLDTFGLPAVSWCKMTDSHLQINLTPLLIYHCILTACLHIMPLDCILKLHSFGHPERS